MADLWWSLVARYDDWRTARQRRRCTAGRHHWKSLTPDRIACFGPGCGKRYGA